MAKPKRIVIVVDDSGDAEIQSPHDMPTPEVLDILTSAVDATADQILAEEQDARLKEKALVQPAPQLARNNKTYLN